MKLKDILRETNFDTIKYSWRLSIRKDNETLNDVSVFTAPIKDYSYEFYGSQVDQNQKRIHDNKFKSAIKRASVQFIKDLKKLYNEGKYIPGADDLEVMMYMDGDSVNTWDDIANSSKEETDAMEAIYNAVEKFR